MPGSIQVSVLNLKKLPSSSNSVKISLGKVEYEARENETFDLGKSSITFRCWNFVNTSKGCLDQCVWDHVFQINGAEFATYR
ncbi:hypothetical protein QVD17_26525 [Tagetes erecta]|uniref:Uncharacterized protein n=1 Tax=Tagetes erecta TaxID=13708 RepID=A0AAD8K981_TARER|nr:hypothetical protein QVD17_26525 [Tagetes erecta]